MSPSISCSGSGFVLISIFTTLLQKKAYTSQYRTQVSFLQEMSISYESDKKKPIQ